MTTEAERPAATLAPIVKEISVLLPIERAFALFTEGIAGWWPLATHSVARQDAVGCRFEAHAGGRLIEVARDGTEHVWGTLLAWEPPGRLLMTWHPGRGPEIAQELEVTFSPDGAGTRVRLAHTGWERLAEVAPDERRSYDSGWDYVLGLYAERAERS
ncbi:MAG TPA: SRPBCC family protein [Candidatus Limnocylindria bacterium]|nr:SRPBCC family protein [Candidatus Limnocylindria bacterium]